MAFLARCPGTIDLPSGEFVQCLRPKRVEVTAGGFILNFQSCPRCRQPFSAYLGEGGAPMTYPADIEVR